MTPELWGWLPAVLAAVAAFAAATAAVRTRKTQRRAAVDANRMDLLWRQVRGAERLDDTQREQLGIALYEQFTDPEERAWRPWGDLDGADQQMWRHQTDRVAAEVSNAFVARAQRQPG